MADQPAAPVPLCDINAQYKFLKPQIDAAVLRVLASGQAILGPEVAAFEKETAEFCKAKYAVGCGSGTDALVLALHALGIGPGDEVIIPPFTFFATAGAVCRVGATPVFADIDPLTYNIDPAQIEAKVTAEDEGDHAGPPLRPVLRHERDLGHRGRARALRHRGRGPVVRQRLPGAEVRHARAPWPR